MHRLFILRFTVFVALAAAIVTPAGCVSPDIKDRVARAQTDAIARLGSAYAEDLAALRAAVDALARVDAAARRADIEAGIVSRYITPDGRADTGALDAALAQPASEPAPDALAAEVRAGAMTPEAARAWLGDYALAWRMSDGAGTRSRLLDALTPVRDLVAARESLLAELDRRAAAVARLFADALASADALARARALEREITGPASARLAEVWRDRVLARVADPDSRRLLETILADFAPDLLPAPADPTP
ncbi:MAG: hypothetical protein D6693_04270 [Planctomycetota bacterium]|nr:MAG: hypothetical protein D6693_04270 [Planctomycetota bacterium]